MMSHGNTTQRGWKFRTVSLGYVRDVAGFGGLVLRARVAVNKVSDPTVRVHRLALASS